MAKGKIPMTQAAASRIQSHTAKSNGGTVPKDSFSARATSASARSAPGNQGKK